MRPCRRDEGRWLFRITDKGRILVNDEDVTDFEDAYLAQLFRNFARSFAEQQRRLLMMSDDNEHLH